MSAWPDRPVPTKEEADALLAMFNAYQELKRLGWNDAIYCPKDGSMFLAIEPGSTDVHLASYEGKWPDGRWWVYDGDMWPSRPCLFKLAPPLPGGPGGPREEKA